MVESALPPFGPGDRVRILEGTFSNFEGAVDGFKGDLVLVALNIFGRPTIAEVRADQLAPADSSPP
jgi:transcription antitermination factor NusG